MYSFHLLSLPPSLSLSLSHLFPHWFRISDSRTEESVPLQTSIQSSPVIVPVAYKNKLISSILLPSLQLYLYEVGTRVQGYRTGGKTSHRVDQWHRDRLL